MLIPSAINVSAPSSIMVIVLSGATSTLPSPVAGRAVTEIGLLRTTALVVVRVATPLTDTVVATALDGVVAMVTGVRSVTTTGGFTTPPPDVGVLVGFGVWPPLPEVGVLVGFGASVGSGVLVGVFVGS